MQQDEFINELTKNQKTTGRINQSKLKQIFRKVKDSPFSIKYVLNGSERYKFEDQSFKVSSGQYFIVNQNDEFTIDFESDEFAHGICIYPPEELINGAFEAKKSTLSNLLESNGEFSNSSNFIHKINSTQKTKTGQFLDQNLSPLVAKLKKGDEIDFNSFFLDLVDYMVIDQINVNQKLVQHSSAKKSTKEELFRRISLAKDYLSDHFKEKINIDELAEMSHLSKYHFLRSFKEFYGLSPYQFLLNHKLVEAQKLREKGYSYSEISLQTGFSDPKNLRKQLKKING